MKTEDFKLLAPVAGAELEKLIERDLTDLAETAKAVIKTAGDLEKKPVLRMGFAIEFDLQTRKVDFNFAYSTQHKLSSSATLPDPRQPELLPRDGELRKRQTKRGKGE
jgi:hypothetical protein